MGRGGYREGSGRKQGSRTAEESVVVRIPLRKKKLVQEAIQHGFEIPHFDARVPMGPLKEIVPHADSTFSLSSIVRNFATTFTHTTEGDSMEPTIYEGDIAIVDTSREPQNNSIVLATINGASTVKRYKKLGGKIWLHPDNKKYPAFELKADDENFIHGVITGTYKDLL